MFNLMVDRYLYICLSRQGLHEQTKNRLLAIFAPNEICGVGINWRKHAIKDSNLNGVLKLAILYTTEVQNGW